MQGWAFSDKEVYSLKLSQLEADKASLVGWAHLVRFGKILHLTIHNGTLVDTKDSLLVFERIPGAEPLFKPNLSRDMTVDDIFLEIFHAVSRVRKGTLTVLVSDCRPTRYYLQSQVSGLPMNIAP